ncbi:MAG: DUF4013 domain-containing protein [Chloroflexota bacterium]
MSTFSVDLSSIKQFFTFPFQDRQSTNRFLIGMALMIAGSIIPLVPMLPALGYIYRIMQRTARGEAPSMPPWEDWGGLFLDGLKLIVIGMAYLLPGSLVMIGGMAAYFIAVFGVAAAGEGSDASTAMGILMMLAVGVMLLSYIGGMLLSFLGGVPLPIAAAHAAATGQVSSAFRVRQWSAVLRRVKGDYLLGWVLVFGLIGLFYLLFVIMYMTIVLCALLPLAAGAMAFWLYLTGGPLFAAIYYTGVQAQEPTTW